MRVMRLSVHNIKRIQDVEIIPNEDANLIIVGGNNAQGKTTLLNCIMYPLAGKASIPDSILRDGAQSGLIELDLGELKAVLAVSKTGKSALTLTDAEGVQQKAPQTLLNKVYGSLTFDPLAFAGMNTKERAQVLRALVGLDTAELDGKRDTWFFERTNVNRKVKEKAAQLKGVPFHSGLPDEEVDFQELLDEQQRRQEENAELERKKSSRDRLLERNHERRAEIKRLQAELEEVQLALTKTERICETEAGDIARMEEFACDPAEITTRIQELSETNRKIRENQVREQLELEHGMWEGKSESLTEQIKGVDKEKAKALAAIQMPIPALSIDGDSILYQDQPFEECSGAEQLRVSVAIGAADNPELKVMLVRDGSLLDANNLLLLEELAKEHGFQIWIERVGEDKEATVILEDGLVKEES